MWKKSPPFPLWAMYPCRMPEKYRVVLYLYYYEGYPVKELSVLLGRRESTLQTRLATGRKLLKESLSNTRL